MNEQMKQWADRAGSWLHDTLIILGVLVVFTLCGGWQVVGYSFDFAFIPSAVMEPVRTAKK